MHSAPAADVAQDRDILALLQSGAVEPAFQLTLARYQDKVYRLCCALLRDPSAAEDAAQESLVRIWKAIGSTTGGHHCPPGSTPLRAIAA